jgi:hypothetical protein
MTEHLDLLGAGAPAAPAPPAKKRGRPPGSGKTKVIAPADVSDKLTGNRAGSVIVDDPLRTLNDGANKEAAYGAAPVVPASTKPTTIAEITAAGEGADDVATPEEQAEAQKALAQLDKEAAERAARPLEVDASYVVPPISVDYELALANRITLIGGGKREYAYQRILRAGKRL